MSDARASILAGSTLSADAARRSQFVTADLEGVINGLREELLACQRLALLGSLTAMVTHEFNNLLTPILARTEAALQLQTDAAFVHKTLERTLVQTQRALSVTRRLLDLAHGQPPAAETCSVVEAVHEALETMARPLDKDGIDLRLEIPPQLRVRARADLLCQVLLNLVLNARRAMHERPGHLAILATPNGTHATIEVRDSGCGIPAERIARVINPFLAANPYERPNDWQHVGLGLSVCRLIAHHHEAAIEAAANPDRGCTFRLRWPLALPS